MFSSLPPVQGRLAAKVASMQICASGSIDQNRYWNFMGSLACLAPTWAHLRGKCFVTGAFMLFTRGKCFFTRVLTRVPIVQPLQQAKQTRNGVISETPDLERSKCAQHRMCVKNRSRCWTRSTHNRCSRSLRTRGNGPHNGRGTAASGEKHLRRGSQMNNKCVAFDRVELIRRFCRYTTLETRIYVCALTQRLANN